MSNSFMETVSRWGRRGTAGTSIAASLAFEDVVHGYGKVRALDGISLAVAPGEVVCLLGPSGCGKTTLLRIASGIERPLSGRVTIDGREVAGPDAFIPPERRGVGLVFQDFALFPHLTNLANVMFGLKALPRAEAEKAARLALSRVGLDKHAEDYPHTLSGGEQQRVALARAIAPRPGILLMDEPFSGLDSRLRDAIRDETLAVMRETRATCIVVTHDPEEAMRMADRIVLLRSGRIAQIGTPSDLYRAPADLDTARFFSDVNEVPGVVRAGRLVTPVGYFAAPGLAEGARRWPRSGRNRSRRSPPACAFPAVWSLAASLARWNCSKLRCRGSMRRSRRVSAPARGSPRGATLVSTLPRPRSLFLPHPAHSFAANGRFWAARNDECHGTPGETSAPQGLRS